MNHSKSFKIFLVNQFLKKVISANSATLYTECQWGTELKILISLKLGTVYQVFRPGLPEKLNPLLPSVAYMLLIAKILILI